MQPRASRGSVNAILNRLVRETVITGFRTNFDDRQATDIQVAVTADLIESPRTALYEGRREEIRQHVARELEALGLRVTVTVTAPAKQP
jgi:hypothetical protein